jgi:hypothetical protein
MRKTIAVLIFFLAALLAGFFARSMVPAPSKASEEPSDGKERFMQRERGMPLDMQKSGDVSGFEGVSPLLGSEPKPVPERPYNMANDQELFQFQDNRISADCCPSPFSSDTGCVCLTDEQMRLFESRGGNKA